jgi:UDP-N-acetylmuramoyl-tripeptide--D-alanyl-D-alanine ligase
MTSFDTSTLLDLTPGRAAAALPAATGAAFHSGRVRRGDAFFALPGEQGHGIDHAEDALARGAAFVVSDRPHPRGVVVPDPALTLRRLGELARASLSCPVVAVTGSAGKTTTRALLQAALQARATAGNLNTELPLSTTLIDAWLDPNTPEALVLEVGIDHPGEMERAASLVRPTHALLTLIGASHLEQFGNLEVVAREKAKLLREADRSYASHRAHRQLDEALRARTVSYALHPYRADVTGTVTASTHGAQRIDLFGAAAWLPALGEGVAENAVGAAAVAHDLGVPPSQIARRLEGVRFEPGRLQLRQHRGATLIDDSYNSNPASAAQALSVLRSLPAPRIAVLGDMLELGAESAARHRALGEATLGLDRVIAVGAWAESVAAGNPTAETAGDLDEAAALLAPLPTSGTLLFKASRGLRFERLIAVLIDEATERNPA